MSEKLSRISVVILGPVGTLILGVMFFGLGITTLSSGPDYIPGREGVAVLCFAAGSAAIASSIFLRQHMSVAHEIMGMVLMMTSIIRGLTWVIGVVNNDLSLNPALFVEYTPPWVWAVVFSSGMLLWAYGRRETLVSQHHQHGSVGEVKHRKG